jgi:hypothetical protein
MVKIPGWEGRAAQSSFLVARTNASVSNDAIKRKAKKLGIAVNSIVVPSHGEDHECERQQRGNRRKLITAVAMSESRLNGFEQAACPDPSRRHLHPGQREDTEARHDPHAGVDQPAPRWQLGDLPHDEFEAGAGREAGLIAALTDRRNVVWHALGFTRGCLLNR